MDNVCKEEGLCDCVFSSGSVLGRVAGGVSFPGVPGSFDGAESSGGASGIPLSGGVRQFSGNVSGLLPGADGACSEAGEGEASGSDPHAGDSLYAAAVRRDDDPQSAFRHEVLPGEAGLRFLGHESFGHPGCDSAASADRPARRNLGDRSFPRLPRAHRSRSLDRTGRHVSRRILPVALRESELHLCRRGGRGTAEGPSNVPLLF